MDAEMPRDPPRIDPVRLARLRSGLLWLSALIPAAFVALLVALRWPAYWMWINFEDTPMTSLEVAVMFAASLVALAAAGRRWIVHAAGWSTLGLLSAAFLWFALDDRFALHERLRDRVLAPHGIRVPLLPWIAPGDFILLLYAIAGLCFLPRLWRLVRGNRGARLRLVGAVVVAACAVGIDTIDLHLLTIPWQRLEQTVEECLELAAQVLFLQAFLCVLLDDVGEAVPPVRETS